MIGTCKIPHCRIFHLSTEEEAFDSGLSDSNKVHFESFIGTIHVPQVCGCLPQTACRLTYTHCSFYSPFTRHRVWGMGNVFPLVACHAILLI